MHVAEIWRYPVKSLGGESLGEAEILADGIAGDRQVLVVNSAGRVQTSRTRPKLLGLRASIADNGAVLISAHPWDSAEALDLVRSAAGAEAQLIWHEGPERFDVLPLSVATDGAIRHMGFDGRRLRPNLVIGGVEGLAERQWPSKRFRIGTALIEAVRLRPRCVMTTFHPDTQEQDLSVLKRIVDELGGAMSLDCRVVEPGWVRRDDTVEIVGEGEIAPDSARN